MALPWTLILAVAGVLVSAAGVVVALIVRQRKLFTWMPGETYGIADLLDEPDDGLELRHKGRPLQAAAMTTVTLRNGGNLAVRAHDFDPGVTIEVRDPEADTPLPVLSARVVDASDPLDRLHLLVRKNAVKVPDATWNRGDWMEVRVVYEGTPEADVEIRGRVLDAPPLRKVVPHARASAWFKATGWALGLGALGVFFASEEGSELEDRAGYVFLAVLGIFWLLPQLWDSNPIRLLRGLPTKPPEDDED